MNVDEVVELALLHPLIKQMDSSIRPKKSDMEKAVALVAQELSLRWDWSFTTDQVDVTSVANQAEYTVTGNSNQKKVRDVINIRYLADGATNWVLLEQKSPVDMDYFLSERSVDGVGWWYESGRDADDEPKVTFVEAPSTAGETLRCRVRLQKITVGMFPSEFKPLIVDGLLAWFLPALKGTWNRDVAVMISRYETGGGDINISRADPAVVRRNNDIAKAYGY